MVKLDNDIILSEDWLRKIYVQAERHYSIFDVFGFTTVNEFFPSSPEEVWAQRLPENYTLTPVPYTGGNFLMKWNVFKKFRHVGIVKNPAHYIVGSLSEVYKSMSMKGLLSIAIISPHLPVFKLDKVAVRKYDQYKFFEKKGIDRRWIEDLIEKYYVTGVCRKRLVNGRIVNRF